MTHFYGILYIYNFTYLVSFFYRILFCMILCSQKHKIYTDITLSNVWMTIIQCKNNSNGDVQKHCSVIWRKILCWESITVIYSFKTQIFNIVSLKKKHYIEMVSISISNDLKTGELAWKQQHQFYHSKWNYHLRN